MSNEQKDKTLFVCTILLVIVHVAGIIGLFSPFRNLFLALTPLNLLLSTFLLLYNHKEFNKQFLLFLSLSFLTGYLIEVIGIKTGQVFGSYTYGNTLGFKIADVPVIIGINWLMLIYCAGVICNSIKTVIFLKSTIGAAMLVGLDFLIEPVAVKYNFWSWNNSIIPINNYIGWFAVSFLLLMVFNSLQFNKTNKLAQTLYIIQLVFFTLLCIL